MRDKFWDLYYAVPRRAWQIIGAIVSLFCAIYVPGTIGVWFAQPTPFAVALLIVTFVVFLVAAVVLALDLT